MEKSGWILNCSMAVITKFACEWVHSELSYRNKNSRIRSPLLTETSIETSRFCISTARRFDCECTARESDRQSTDGD